MSAAETREIQIPAIFQKDQKAAVEAPAPPRQRSTSELTKTERDDLLAQIDRAARRVQETSVDLSRVEAALASGRLDEARQLIAQVEAASPRALGLQRLKERVAEEAEAERRRRIAETEQVLSNYIQRKQLPLARLALETLAELDPQSPKRAEHEAALGRLSLELEQEKRAAAALEAGREALGRNDVQAARRELEVVVRNDPSGKKAASLRADVEAAEREARTGAELDERRRRFDEMLKDHRVRDAEQELEALSQLDIPRVTLSFYRERLDEIRAWWRGGEGVLEMSSESTWRSDCSPRRTPGDGKDRAAAPAAGCSPRRAPGSGSHQQRSSRESGRSRTSAKGRPAGPTVLRSCSMDPRTATAAAAKKR